MYHTRYTNDAIRIGESRDSILKKFGRPYSEDLVYEDGKLTSIVCYKELMAYGYTLRTFFYFQDSVLVKKVQVDDSPSKITLKESQE